MLPHTVHPLSKNSGYANEFLEIRNFGIAITTPKPIPHEFWGDPAGSDRRRATTLFSKYSNQVIIVPECYRRTVRQTDRKLSMPSLHYV